MPGKQLMLNVFEETLTKDLSLVIWCAIFVSHLDLNKQSQCTLEPTVQPSNHSNCLSFSSSALQVTTNQSIKVNRKHRHRPLKKQRCVARPRAPYQPVKIFCK